MDSEIVIPVLIVLALCLIPICIMKIKSLSRKRKAVGFLYKLAKQFNESVFQTGNWNNSAIGLTKNGSHIFVVRKNKNEFKSQTINLSLFNNCRVINDNSNSPYKEGNFKVTDKVELELTGTNKAVERICFYDREEDGDLLTDELQMAETWRRKINEFIAKKG